MFGTLDPEKICHEHLADLSTSPVICSQFALGNSKKSNSRLRGCGHNIDHNSVVIGVERAVVFMKY